MIDAGTRSTDPSPSVVYAGHVGSEWRLILNVGDSGREPTLANALTSASVFGLNREEGVSLLEELRRYIARHWRTTLKMAGLTDHDIEKLTHNFAESEREDWQRADD